MDRRDVCILITGSAIGAVASSLVWKYLHQRSSQKTALFQALSASSCWPFDDSNLKSPTAINLISEYAEFQDVVHKFIVDVNKVKVLGFDCEWTTSDSTPNPVALLQLATCSGACYIFRLCKLHGILPKEVLKTLQNKNIIKVGVGSLEDASKLLRNYGIVTNGCLDLRAFAARYQLTRSRSLQSLANEMLGITLNKSMRLTCSNWNADVLSKEQIIYAASDAFSAIQIFKVFLKTRLQNVQSHFEVDKAVQTVVWSIMEGSIQGLVDIPFREPKMNMTISHSRNAGNHARAIPKSPKMFKAMKSHSTRQHPLYDNCRLQAPDGQLLSTCDRKKAVWYLDRKLAELVADDPFTVRLFFEPSGRPENDRDYYLFEKENKCVVCGGTDSFVRKNIIPHEYRKHFTFVMKDHTSHDILLLCLSCHQQSNYYDCLFRRQLSEEYNAPQGSLQSVRLLENPERRSVRSAGRALEKAGNRIPEERRTELQNIILDFFGASEITDDFVAEASGLETRIKNEAYIPHGEKVVRKVFHAEGPEGLLRFERRWREHFLTTMKPAHLPLLWSVDHNHEKVMRTIDKMGEEFQRNMKAKTKPATR